MEINDLLSPEQERRWQLARQTRTLVAETLPVEAADDTTLLILYGDFCLQVSFSPLHPLMVLCLARALIRPCSTRHKLLINNLNLDSVLGGHAINEDTGWYSYRATVWLETELSPARFLEILERCMVEARRGFLRLANQQHSATCSSA